MADWQCRSAIAAAGVALLMAPAVNAQNVPPPANSSTQPTSPPTKPPREATNPAFPGGRGGNGPLQLPIGGLSDGSSRIAAGKRPFSLCWQGGSPPFAVGVVSEGSAQLLSLDNLGSQEIAKAPVDIAPGRYNIDLGDGSGARAAGRFTAVPPSAMPDGERAPTSQGDALAQANSLRAQGPSFVYEAYLRLMALDTKDAETERVLDAMCHRAGAAEGYPAGPAVSFGGTEMILSSEIASVDESDPSAPSPILSYLTDRGEIYAEAIYTYSRYTASTAAAGGRASTARVAAQQATAVLAYGITDDLAVGADVPWTTDNSTLRCRIGVHLLCRSNNPDLGPGLGLDDPTFFGTYRVLAQSRAPGTLFLQASYSPGVANNGVDVWDVGGTLVRWEKNFAIAAELDAARVGASSRPGSGSVLDAYWRGNATLAVFIPIDRRWGASLSASDRLPFDRTISSSDPGTRERSNAVSVSPAISFDIVPQKLSIWLTYDHTFSSNYSDTRLLPSAGSVTKLHGTDLFGVVLSANDLPDAIARAVE